VRARTRYVNLSNGITLYNTLRGKHEHQKRKRKNVIDSKRTGLDIKGLQNIISRQKNATSNFQFCQQCYSYLKAYLLSDTEALIHIRQGNYKPTKQAVYLKILTIIQILEK